MKRQGISPWRFILHFLKKYVPVFCQSCHFLFCFTGLKYKCKKQETKGVVVLSIKARLLAIKLAEKQKSNIDVFNKICVDIKTENDKKSNGK